MANDIARNLEAMGPDKAVLATADHIDKFWDPRMKTAIFADDGTASRRSRARRSSTSPAAPIPDSQTRATEFNTAHEIGHSDAG